MIIAIIFGVFVACVFIFSIWEEAESKKRRNEMDEITKNFVISQFPIKPYSVSDYYDGMEKYQLSLQAEKESREPYLLILWWGFDGLRLNEDGATEWISRRPTPKQTEIKHQSLNPLITQISRSDCQSTSAQIASLQSQMQQCMNTAAQMQQYQNIINALQPAPYPAYPTYYGASPYTPNYNHYYYGFPAMGCHSCQENKD